MGRPTKYSEELGDKIARHILEGLTIKDACFGAGISEDTFQRWRYKYSEFNKKVVEASNRQWESSEAIAKYHSGYRGYKRPKMRLSPNYGSQANKLPSSSQKPLLEPLKAPKPQFWHGLPVRYEVPVGVATPKYYNATANMVEWVERGDAYGQFVYGHCRPEVYLKKLQERAWQREIDSWFTVI